MKKMVSLALASAILLTPLFSAWAVEKHAKNPPHEEYKLKFEKSPHSERSEDHDFDEFRIGLSGPLMLISGEPFFGMSVFGLGEVAPRFLLGAEMGYYSWSRSVGSLSASINIIPILATALYHFGTATGSVAPYLGLSMGMAFVNISGTTGSYSASVSGTGFEFLARGGAFFGERKNVLGEVKLGSIAGMFIFLPSIGYIF